MADKPVYGVVYLVTNTVNCKVYVGQTTRPTVRWGEHWYGSHNNPRSRLQYSIRKYGKSNFHFAIVAEAESQDQLDHLERLWIICLNTLDKRHGYNLTSGGEHFTHTAETRAKIAAAGRGRTCVRPRGVDSPSYGRRMSAEARAKMSVAKSIKHGRPMPQSVKDALRKGFAEKNGLQKVIAANKARAGRIVSEETKQRMKDSRNRYLVNHAKGSDGG